MCSLLLHGAKRYVYHVTRVVLNLIFIYYSSDSTALAHSIQPCVSPGPNSSILTLCCSVIDDRPPQTKHLEAEIARLNDERTRLVSRLESAASESQNKIVEVKEDGNRCMKVRSKQLISSVHQVVQELESARSEIQEAQEALERQAAENHGLSEVCSAFCLR